MMLVANTWGLKPGSPPAFWIVLAPGTAGMLVRCWVYTVCGPARIIHQRLRNLPPSRRNSLANRPKNH